jgi:hypothetical protein
MSLAKSLALSVAIFCASSRSSLGQPPVHHDLASDLQVTSTPLPDGTVSWDLKNLSPSPLVAVTFVTECGAKRRGFGEADSALAYASPQKMNQSRGIARDGPECANRVTSAIFADGTREGDADALKQIMLRRSYAIKHLRPFMIEAFRQYDSIGIIDTATLKQTIVSRESQLDKATIENMDRLTTEHLFYQFLLEQTEHLETYTGKANFKEAEEAYLQILDSWSRLLSTGNFPKRLLGLP